MHALHLTIGSCFNVRYRVMEHVGSLESIHEARVALGYCHGQLLRFFRALQTSLASENLVPCAHCFPYYDD